MAADERDPLLAREPGTLRWWIVAAVIATIIAAVTVTATVLLARQPSWEPVPVPTGVPS
ncbi:MAG: hypothetical protein Q4F67_13005 [Propionibacteriaceae bacterium]|nr:hypothetical protein [Propionibacteriaceae bacterium]